MDQFSIMYNHFFSRAIICAFESGSLGLSVRWKPP